ncbi:MotA/TolQ/ExbB proton channel family protein [Sediminispirochaeta smaragdinae]|uniref:MotA/TolQ/ExbB proton channel n=1 Tax=Sediminispirochaeta smaragdinae (strain DSM 11293 / JCM 15392 / SEBR 4228) TaxID=573413 RepID=E1R114_SEDSS|nr:MotA/TolQ/ExbB proton channel family protein [Sediminispirochaeta smaragdinae]ADK80263.1 MotA/TolQ/ExbB proton channel [Sediminispirochaeta smaragdinae DSM 11293]
MFLETFHHIVAFIQLGGILNWILVGLYLVVLVLAVDRCAYFIRTGYQRNRLVAGIDSAFFASISDNGTDGQTPAFPWPKHYAKSQPVRMIALVLEDRRSTKEALDEAVDREGSAIRREMDRGLEALSVIGNIAPLMGLLGTVTGLMRAFHRIESLGGTVDIAAFSGGIWEAMITTAIGLIVAIPAVVFCRVFEKIVERRGEDMGYVVSLVSESLHEGTVENPRAGQSRESA